MPKNSSLPPFNPQRVYIEEGVQDLPFTQEVLSRLKPHETEIIKHSREIRVPAEMSWGKKGLLLARFKPDETLKEFEAMSQSLARSVYSLNVISNCHLECTYCILQSYLENNPIITFYVNREEIIKKLADQLDRIPRGSVVGTGQLADSLALEGLTQWNQHLIPFFAEQDRVFLELKTKSADVEPLLDLKHKGQTVVSWSMSTEKVQEEEEYKTASIPERIEAMTRCQKAGYPVGIHFDPIIHHVGWEKNYRRLVEQIFHAVDAENVAWISIGGLRFPTRQVKAMRDRFPKNRKIFTNLVSTNKRFMYYPDRLRESLYNRLRSYLKPHFPEEKTYLSMEAELSGQADKSAS
jgi:spore photoproduct lyase